MRIAVDIMGGDHAPSAIMSGTTAAPNLNLDDTIALGQMRYPLKATLGFDDVGCVDTSTSRMGRLEPIDRSLCAKNTYDELNAAPPSGVDGAHLAEHSSLSAQTNRTAIRTCRSLVNSEVTATIDKRLAKVAHLLDLDEQRKTTLAGGRA